MPILWRVPGVAVEGRVCDALVENVDLAPTFMDLCGLPAMEGMDGADISELFAGWEPIPCVRWRSLSIGTARRCAG